MKRTSVKRLSPNTLRAQLAASQIDPRTNGAHPDADLLTAFAENALLDRERADLLAHLAGCSDCRSIVQTALDASPEHEASPSLDYLRHRPLPDPVPQPAAAPAPPLTAAAFEQVSPRRRMPAWFPGVALAASLLVMAGSTILFYRALRTLPARIQTAAVAPAPQLATETTPQPAASPATNTTLESALAAPLKQPHPSEHGRSTAPPSRMQRHTARIGAATAPPPPLATGISSSAALGDQSIQPAQNTLAEQAQLRAQMQSEMTAYHAATTARAAQSSSAPAAATESVKVQAGDRFARSLQTNHPVAGLIRETAPRPRFRIDGAGRLERSIQSGVWTPVVIAPDTHFRVVSISGSDVWAGGDRLRLFHSADSGLTWSEVRLPTSADRSHDVAHILIEGPQHITIEDDTGASWTTTDAGTTWQ
jgi:hypothetical protein